MLITVKCIKNACYVHVEYYLNQNGHNRNLLVHFLYILLLSLAEVLLRIDDLLQSTVPVTLHKMFCITYTGWPKVNDATLRLCL